MTWRYILKQLGMPPGSLLILLLAAWLLRRTRPRLAAMLFFLSLGSLYALCLPTTTQWLAGPLENQPALKSASWPELSRRADAIVVLGGGREPADTAWESDRPSLFASQRLRYAARLHKASGLPILVSGGLHYGQPPSEARIMADSLQDDYGVSVRWLEEDSRTTRENAFLTAQRLLPEGKQRILLVTDAWHMWRSRWSFEQAGFQVIPAPQGFYSASLPRPLGGWLPESKAFWQNIQLLNEWLGIQVYRVQNHITPGK